MEMTFKVEKNVPCPVKGGCTIKYPFASMEVGDSFLINGDVAHNKVANAGYSFGRGRNWRFRTQKTPEGYRCWRIA